MKGGRARAIPLLLAALILVAAPPARPEDPLARLDAERRALRSLSFAATIETPKPGGRTGRSAMTFDYLAPGFYRSEIRMGVEGTMLTVADGTWIWSWQSRARKLYRQAQSTSEERLRAMGAADPVTALATPSLPLASLFRVVAAGDTASPARLVLEPLRASPSYDRILLVIAADGRTPRSIEVTQRGRLVARVRFDRYSRNASVAASLFSYRPPRGVVPVEIR